MFMCVCVYVRVYIYIYIYIYIYNSIETNTLFYSSLKLIYYLVCKFISCYEVDMNASQQNWRALLMDKMNGKKCMLC
jgi:hypothetical protein